MAIDNNDDIAKMFGTGSFGNKKTDDKKIIEMEEVKFSNIDGKGIEDKLKNVPPAMLIGIVCIVAGVMSPYRWLYTIGFCCIIIGVFDKILGVEKKALLFAKIKTLINYKKRDKTKCPKCQGELIIEDKTTYKITYCTKCEYTKKE